MDPLAQVLDVPARTAGLSVPGIDCVLYCVHTAAVSTPAAVSHVDIVIAAVDGTADDEVFDAEDVFVVIAVVVIHTSVAVEFAADEVVVVEAVVDEAVAVEYVVVAVVDLPLVACSAYVAEEDCPLDNMVVDVHTSVSPIPKPLLHCSYCTYWADPPSLLVHLS